MKELKQFQKRAFMIAGTGIGLSAMAGISADANTSKAIGNMGKGLGTMGNLAVMDASLSMLSKSAKMKK